MLPVINIPYHYIVIRNVSEWNLNTLARHLDIIDSILYSVHTPSPLHNTNPIRNSQIRERKKEKEKKNLLIQVPGGRVLGRFSFKSTETLGGSSRTQSI